MTVETPIFIQDNALCHKTKTMLSFLEEEGKTVTRWPPQIPDMNFIEKVWKNFGVKVHDRNLQNIDDLWGFLKEEWECIPTIICKKFIGSRGQICNEVSQCKR